MVLIRHRGGTAGKDAVEVGGLRVSLARAVVVSTAAAVVVVGGLIAAGLWWFGIGTRVGGHSDTVVSIIQLAFAFVAGVGGSVGLTVAYRKHQLEERAEVREDSTHFNERYGAALDQLGSDAYAVRLGGVYAMAGLADDWEQGRQQCIDVLCACLRREYQPEPPEPDLDQPETSETFALRQAWDDDREFRHTTIRVIAEHLRIPPGQPRSWCGRDFDFTGAIFDGGDLAGIQVTGGTLKFSDAIFRSGITVFSHAAFSGGTVDFIGASFRGGRVRFDHSSFTGGAINFLFAKFDGPAVDFGSVVVDGGSLNLSGAVFSDGVVVFISAEFRRGSVDLSFAEFNGAKVAFLHADFSGAEVDFSGAEFKTGAVEFGGLTPAHGELPAFSDTQRASGVLRLPAKPDTSEKRNQLNEAAAEESGNAAPAGQAT